MLRAFVLLALLAGCDQLFGMHEVTPGTDGPTVADAPDLTRCPSSYQLAFRTESRYRFTISELTAWALYDECARDMAGWTHLAVIGSAEENAFAQAAVDGRGPLRAYVGYLQRPGATSIGGDWFWVNGETAPPIWNVNEPTDVDSTSEQGVEQFTTLERGSFGLIDIPGAITYPALCECDGRGVTMEASAAVDAYRM